MGASFASSLGASLAASFGASLGASFAASFGASLAGSGAFAASALAASLGASFGASLAGSGAFAAGAGAAAAGAGAGAAGAGAAAGAGGLTAAFFSSSAICWFFISSNFCRSATFFSRSPTRDCESFSARSRATRSSSRAALAVVAPGLAGSAFDSFSWSFWSAGAVASALGVMRPATSRSRTGAAGAVATACPRLRLYSAKSAICDCTCLLASAAPMAAIASRSGMFRMRPARTRLTLPLMKASWLARYSAISIWFSVTPAGRFWRAIAPSVSPFFTSCCLASVETGAAGAGAGRDSARGFVGAGAAGAAAGAGLAAGAGAAAGCGGLNSAGSSRNVYSRTRRPVDQDSSISTSRNGSLIAWLVLSRITGLPARLSTENCSPTRAELISMPAWLNASLFASRAESESSSPGCSDTISISARSGWPRAESTWSLPRPAAWTISGANSSAAMARRIPVTELATKPTLSRSAGTDYHNIMALALQPERPA